MGRADWGLGCDIEFILRVYILTPGESTDAEVADFEVRSEDSGLGSLRPEAPQKESGVSRLDWVDWSLGCNDE